MLVDHHLHLENRSGLPGEPSFQNPEPYVHQGVKEGVGIFGFSDHAYVFNEAENANFNSWQNERRHLALEDYVRTVENFRGICSSVLLGLEIDYSPKKEKEICEFIAYCNYNYGIDFFIGSVHWIDDWGFDLNEQEYNKRMDAMTPEAAFRKYFEAVNMAIESRLFQIIGHIDLIKIFNRRPVGECDIWKETASLLNKYNQAIEINTNGFNKPVKEQYPGYDFIQTCIENKIPLTLGSDAHTPERVGENFAEIKTILSAFHVEELAYFKKQCLRFVKI